MTLTIRGYVQLVYSKKHKKPARYRAYRALASFKKDVEDGKSAQLYVNYSGAYRLSTVTDRSQHLLGTWSAN